MKTPERDDLSRFLVHLTREYVGKSAEENLLSILRSKRIEARNPHCLFQPKFKHLHFPDVLKKQFNSVCFTEVPFSQLRHLAAEIKGRRIKLQPYGLVFGKEDMLTRGASPALYINAKGTSLRDHLIAQFDQHFSTRAQYKKLKNDFGAQADSIIHYYSLINVISDTHDFHGSANGGTPATSTLHLFTCQQSWPKTRRRSPSAAKRSSPVAHSKRSHACLSFRRTGMWS